MVLALPITSHADGEKTEENVQNTPNYTGVGTETKLEAEIREILEEEPEITLSVEEETPAVDSKEELPEETSAEETPADETNTENKEAVEEEKEAFTLTDAQRQALKEAGYTDSEIEKIEAEIANKLDVDANLDAQALVDEKVAEKTPALELAEETKPEAVEAGEETEAGRDISNDITEAEIHVGETQTTGVLNAGNGEGLPWSVAFKAPDDTKAGDYFDITLSDNWSLKGIEPDTENADPIKINDKIVADGKRLSRHQIRYTFNDNITSLDEIRVAVQYGGYDVKETVQNSKTQTFTVSVGNHSDSKDLYVDYGKVNYDDYQRILNGTSQYTHFDPKTGEFTQVFYINPESRYIGKSTGEIFNGSVGVIVDGRGFDGNQSDAYFTQENTSVEVVKLAPRTNVPDAVYENPVDGDIDSSISPVIQDGKVFLDFNRNGIDNPYIITVKSKIDPNVEYINLGSRATLYGNGTLDLGLVNQIQFKTGNTGGSGVEEKKGSFQEHHIYQTKKLDGTIVKDDEVNKDVTEGTEKENYKTSKEDRAGYKLIEVKSVNGGQFNKDGSLKEAAYIADTKQEVTYIYQKEEKAQTPIEETGKFQEHHIYITKNEKGEEVDRKEVNGDVTGGTKDMTYTTGKKEKDGFEFVRTEKPVNEPAYKEDGSETKGNYKVGVTQEITYVYEKTVKTPTPVEETGKFVEHHIYITKDESGKEISRKTEDGKTQEGIKDETYTTGKKEKDGFTFVRTEKPVNEPTYKEDGSETKGNYKVGVTQEITYVYEKTVKKPVEPSEPVEPGTPEDPEKPVTPEKPGNPENPEKPVTPEKPGNPEDPEKPATPEKPGNPEDPEKPVTPEKPGNPEDPEKPVTPEKPGNPEDPEKPVTPEKPGKPSEPEKPTNPEKPVTPVKPQDPQSPVTDNKPTKDEKVENPKTPTKTMDTIKTHGSTKQASKNPKTGLGSSVGIAGIAISSILASIGVEKKKKEDK